MNTDPLPGPRLGLLRLLPSGVDPSALPMLAARALRAFGDGYMAVLLPAYLLSMGLGTLEVGIVSTATMLGSALATLAVGAWGYRFASGRLLRGAALLMAATGLGFAGLSSFWPLLIVALVGTLNPSSGDVSVFLPLEHERLAAAARGHARTALFARYSLMGALCAALGALAAAVPDWLVRHTALAHVDALRGMFLVYAAIGLAVFWLYRNVQAPVGVEAVSERVAPTPLGPSRSVVVRLAALFSVDAFAGGLTVNALMSLWLLERFGLSLTQAGVFFFWTGLLSAASQLAAPLVAQRIGLLNTMVFTHLPANVCLVLAALAHNLPVALALLMVRSALSSMDVPTRNAYVMTVVTPAERSAAASFTAVPRSLAAALSPTLSGALFAAGWISMPLIACGLLKISYDLALWRAMRGTHHDEKARNAS
ncbi:Major Facilitator Superfamily protein [Variovorax sp. PBL-H6]|uniref:MFS transporter n=1 Tax=Variovorax sp. PBL-H6 TaxID=434009 RepID=UPI00131947DB|nr:MFS transporter [Variovorax sp. PBL-H6]VTU21547.1 Major Facilitator Superfamily protein [Variovorax sp. PBL-H6]